MDHDSQFIMVSIGILLGQDNPKLDMSGFNNLEEIRIFLNKEYNINVKVGMAWPQVLKEIETGITNKRFSDAMGIVQ